ncbi:angiopoietin-related protein 4 [Aplochiton taeniatus]
MKTLAVLILCLAMLMATGFPFERRGGSPSSSSSSSSGSGKEKRVQYAAWDDVNVIAHGMLQLGQGLKEHVDKTKGQMRDIATKLKTFNSTVSQLGLESQRLKAEGEALRARALGLEDREAQVLNVSAELREKAEEMQQERMKVKERLSRLEERVDGLLPSEGLPDMNAGNAAGNYTDARIIQWMLEAQNQRIDELVNRMRLQQEKLDKQNVRIRTLQHQIQLTKERPAFKRSKVDEPVQNGSTEQRDSPIDMASDCHELFLRGETASGLYTIQPLNSQPFDVFCQMTAEGGWTVIQRRQDGSVDFDQLWQAYKSGFGSLNGEFWLGLEKIHAVSKDADYILKVEFSDWRDDAESILYPFHLGGEESKYALRIQENVASGNLESALETEPSGLPFSTRDLDNDLKMDTNCAKQLSGGWWFSNCGRSNLNGRYLQSPPPKQRHQRKQGVFWKTWRGRYYPLKTTSLMIAPAEIHKKA